jgi:hypothetical protein
MLSVNFFCNISSYDILAYITKNYCYMKTKYIENYYNKGGADIDD